MKLVGVRTALVEGRVRGAVLGAAERTAGDRTATECDGRERACLRIRIFNLRWSVSPVPSNEEKKMVSRESGNERRC